MFALFILVLLNAKTIANADYVIEDTFEGESYKIYGPPTIPKQFSATLETVAHQSDKVSTPLILYTYIICADLKIMINYNQSKKFRAVNSKKKQIQVYY